MQSAETPPWRNTRSRWQVKTFYTTRSGRIVKTLVNRAEFLACLPNPTFRAQKNLSTDERSKKNKKNRPKTVKRAEMQLLSQMKTVVVNDKELGQCVGVNEERNVSESEMAKNLCESVKYTLATVGKYKNLSKTNDLQRTCSPEKNKTSGLTFPPKGTLQIDHFEVPLSTLRKRTYHVLLMPLEHLHLSKSTAKDDKSTEQGSRGTKKKLNRKEPWKPVARKEWNSYKKGKLKGLVNNNLDWDEIALKLGFPARECEEVYSSMFRRKCKPRAKTKETRQVGVTARRGTLKYRQQFRQNLDAMMLPRPKLQDLFAGAEAFTQAKNVFSSDLFIAPSPRSFLPVTPNTRPPVGLNGTVATPLWFKTPTGCRTRASEEWIPQTPAETEDPCSLQTTMGDREKKIRDADRIIVQLQSKMMKGTLKVSGEAKATANETRRTTGVNRIDLALLKDYSRLKSKTLEEDSDVDEYFSDFSVRLHWIFLFCGGRLVLSRPLAPMRLDQTDDGVHGLNSCEEIACMMDRPFPMI